MCLKVRRKREVGRVERKLFFRRRLQFCCCCCFCCCRCHCFDLLRARTNRTTYCSANCTAHYYTDCCTRCCAHRHSPTHPFLASACVSFSGWQCRQSRNRCCIRGVAAAAAIVVAVRSAAAAAAAVAVDCSRLLLAASVLHCWCVLQC